MAEEAKLEAESAEDVNQEAKQPDQGDQAATGEGQPVEEPAAEGEAEPDILGNPLAQKLIQAFFEQGKQAALEEADRKREEAELAKLRKEDPELFVRKLEEKEALQQQQASILQQAQARIVNEVVNWLWSEKAFRNAPPERQREILMAPSFSELHRSFNKLLREAEQQSAARKAAQHRDMAQRHRTAAPEVATATAPMAGPNPSSPTFWADLMEYHSRKG